jgi:catechol 2,3-dioxygenase-like lactoylglutathione lyase family enzyme
MRNLRLAPCLLLAALTSAQSVQPATNAVRLTKYILGVSDLDRTYAFYHALGLDFENPKATLAKPNALPDMLLKLVDVPPGTKFRNMMLKIPGAPFSLEVTEFSNLDLHPARPRVQDPGASLLVLTVANMDAAIAAAKKAGAEVVTKGGKPVAAGRAGTPTFIVKDPDGYYVDFQQAAPQAGPNITGSHFVSVVQDAEKAAAFYHDKLGFETKIDAWELDANQAAGIPNMQFRIAEATIPGTSLTWMFAEFKAADRKPYIPRIPDPGAPALGMQVRDLESAAQAVKAAGGASITIGGGVALGGAKVGFIRDPSGILVELSQPR